MKTLTDKQTTFYRYLVAYQDNAGYSPAIREMCSHMGWKSTHSAREYLQALEKKGYVTVSPGIARGLKLNRRVES